MTIRSVFMVLLLTAFGEHSFAQVFTRITDPTNPIATAPGSGIPGYSGAAWMDYDDDGDIDLFACPNRLYRNDGGGIFVKIEGHGIGAGLPNAPSTGVTWADMDNDGDLDCMFVGAASVLYRNNGKDSGYSFTAVHRGEISSTSTRGWAGAWGDYDNDGFVDLIITHPRGFVGAPIKNPFFRNLGAGEMVKITSGDVVKDLAPYTVATWYDYDLDGDQDLFIGSGPAGTPARDYIFKNLLKETGVPTLSRINEGSIGLDQVDGQVWNWIDYDNDGDLDAYLTNYGGVPNNSLYRNDNGTYVSMSFGDVGTIVSANNNSLANIWADFDNDGDVDCFVTRDGNRPCLYYTNNGNGTFTKVDTIPPVKTAIQHITAVAGDYDADGDMDIFVVSGSATDELYRNDQPSDNNWITVRVKGYPLNRSAIGAKVKVKATINGKSYWQMREISAQNSFNGHNSHTAHIGLGDAAVIDSLVVEWLSGSKKVMTSVAAKQHITIVEESSTSYLRAVFYGDTVVGQVPLTVNFTNLSFGDTSSTPVSWEWDFDNDGTVDATTKNPSTTYTVADSYSVRLVVSDGVKTDTLIRPAHIIAEPARPVISFNTVQHHFGNIDVNTEMKDTIVWVYNRGKVPDSVTVTLIHGVTALGTVKPDSALSLSPRQFVLAPNDSQALHFTFYPRRIIRTSLTITYTPKIVVTSKDNLGTKVFEKSMLFKLVGTLVNVEQQTAVPSEYALEQNFPNPFNPSTVIRFSLPERSTVQLVLHDALGRELITLAGGEFHAGVHAITLSSDHLSSGLYFYTLRTGAFVETKKLLLMK